jgi:cephalosporin-C deacetylase-like acetyl esterase
MDIEMRTARITDWCTQTITVGMEKPLSALLLAIFLLVLPVRADEPVLRGTKTAEIPANIHDIQYQQTENVLLNRIEQSAKAREAKWKRDFSSADAYAKSVEERRATVARLIGVGDRPAKATPGPGIRLIAEKDRFTVYEVEFQIYDDVRGDGLLLVPHGEQKLPLTVVCHAEDASPEVDGLAQYLVTGGKDVVLVPRFVPRASDHPDSEKYHKDLRYLLHRFSYSLGRHPIGVDVDTVAAAIDAVRTLKPEWDQSNLSIYGTRQGGTTAMYAAALDARLQSVMLIDAFEDRSKAYDEPADRAIFRHLVEFDDSDVCSLIAPRELTIVSPQRNAVARVESIYRKLGAAKAFKHIDRQEALGEGLLMRPADEIKAHRDKLYAQLKEHFHKMIEASADVRAKRWATDAKTPEAFQPTQKKLREAYLDLVGRCDFLPRVPLDPRSQKAYDTDEYVGYKVLLDVFDGLEAYGILLIPKNIKPGERRPAVICQHGFAGTPEKTIGPGELDQYYHRFPHTLAQRGYVTFSPYIVVPTEESEYRLDRRGKVVGESRVSVCRQQYAAIVDFLQSLDFVDPDRIGYQGLSYGGFTGLWVVSQEPRISPVIVAGYFSDWKARLYDDTKGYMPIRSECMYVWDELNTFNHSDLAAMICPRPFYIEHGVQHGPDWVKWSTSEHQHVEALYQQLGIPDRERFDIFPGHHETGTEKAFEFLDKWLKFTPVKKPTGVVYPDAKN